jgi:hypothetical protein
MLVNNDDQWNLCLHSGENESYEGYEEWLEQIEAEEESEAELAALANYYRHEIEQEQEGE